MVCLQLSDGKVTTDLAEMRRHAVAFYMDLFSADSCDVDSASELLQGLPQLSPGDRDVLNRDITLDELSAAVSQMASGKAPGIDGLPSDFFKDLWSLLGRNLLDMFKECFIEGILPSSCRHAVISLIPKKGDLTLLKIWRLVALLCADYEILSKVLSNRLKMVIELLIGVDQSYCIPDRSMIDNLFLMRDVFDICNVDNAKLGIISIDQEKAFSLPDLAQSPPAVVSAYTYVFLLRIKGMCRYCRNVLFYMKTLPQLRLIGIRVREGVWEKVEVKVSKWNPLLPYLSYRGRVLIANNLVASSLWHILLVLMPLFGLLEEVQRLLVKFVWSGQHWLCAVALYLQVAEGGQGLIDVLSRTTTFRLQTAQRLLYGCGYGWLTSAQLLLRRVGWLGLDKQLFLLNLDQVDLSGLVPFYSSVVGCTYS